MRTRRKLVAEGQTCHPKRSRMQGGVAVAPGGDLGAVGQRRVVVGHGGDPGHLGQTVDRVAVLHLAQGADRVRGPEGVPQAHPGQAEGLGHGAQDDHLLVALQQGEGRLPPEVDVGLVDHEESLARIPPAPPGPGGRRASPWGRWGWPRRSDWRRRRRGRRRGAPTRGPGAPGGGRRSGSAPGSRRGCSWGQGRRCGRPPRRRRARRGSAAHPSRWRRGPTRGAGRSARRWPGGGRCTVGRGRPGWRSSPRRVRRRLSGAGRGGSRWCSA